MKRVGGNRSLQLWHGVLTDPFLFNVMRGEFLGSVSVFSVIQYECNTSTFVTGIDDGNCGQVKIR